MNYRTSTHVHMNHFSITSRQNETINYCSNYVLLTLNWPVMTVTLSLILVILLSKNKKKYKKNIKNCLFLDVRSINNIRRLNIYS